MKAIATEQSFGFEPRHDETRAPRLFLSSSVASILSDGPRFDAQVLPVRLKEHFQPRTKGHEIDEYFDHLQQARQEHP